MSQDNSNEAQKSGTGVDCSKEEPINALLMTDEEFKTHLAKSAQIDRENRIARKRKFQEKHADFTKSAWDMTDEEFKQACDRTVGKGRCI